MNYSELNLKKDNSIEKVEINGKVINVLQYLSIEDKNEIVTLAVQEGEVNGVYNDLLVEMYKNIYIVFYYTDLEFIKDEKDRIGKLYDELYSSGVLKLILDSIPNEELAKINSYIASYKEAKAKSNLSVSAVIKSMLETLPEDAEKLANIVENFDKDKYTQLVELAEATGKR